MFSPLVLHTKRFKQQGPLAFFFFFFAHRAEDRLFFQQIPSVATRDHPISLRGSTAVSNYYAQAKGHIVKIEVKSAFHASDNDRADGGMVCSLSLSLLCECKNLEECRKKIEQLRDGPTRGTDALPHKGNRQSMRLRKMSVALGSKQTSRTNGPGKKKHTHTQNTTKPSQSLAKRQAYIYIHEPPLDCAGSNFHQRGTTSEPTR